MARIGPDFTRACAAATLFAAMFVGLGCSWITSFAVSNRSDAPIDVTYFYTGAAGECPLLREGLAQASTQTLDGWRPHGEWVELSVDHYRFDREACSIEITLPPKTALRIATEVNYTGHDSGHSSFLADLRLTLVSPSGEVTLAGLELVRSFSKRSETLYEFAYQRPGWLKSSLAGIKLERDPH